MSEYLTPEQVAGIAPGFTVGALAQMRYKGVGPKYLKPSAKRVLYRRQDVVDWLEASERTGTAAA